MPCPIPHGAQGRWTLARIGTEERREVGEEGREWAEPPGDFQLGAPSCGVPAVVFSLSVRFSEFECACEGCFCEHDRVLCIELDPLSRTLVSQVLFLNDQNSLSVFLRRGGKFSLFQRKGEIVFSEKNGRAKKGRYLCGLPWKFCMPPSPQGDASNSNPSSGW